jgi:hypothetical protein
MVAIVVAWLGSTALAGTCGQEMALDAAAKGGWLMPSERTCLHRKAGRKHSKQRALASRLLLDDAVARGDVWGWKSLAEAHIALAPHDGEVWLQLAQHAQRHGAPHDVVRLCNEALGAVELWSEAPDDERVLAMHRLRTYAAIHARQGRGLDEAVVSYAKAWLAAARERAPAVAWELAGETPPES